MKDQISLHVKCLHQEVIHSKLPNIDVNQSAGDDDICHNLICLVYQTLTYPLMHWKREFSFEVAWAQPVCEIMYLVINATKFQQKWSKIQSWQLVAIWLLWFRFHEFQIFNSASSVFPRNFHNSSQVLVWGTWLSGRSHASNPASNTMFLSCAPYKNCLARYFPHTGIHHQHQF